MTEEEMAFDPTIKKKKKKKALNLDAAENPTDENVAPDSTDAAGEGHVAKTEGEENLEELLGKKKKKKTKIPKDGETLEPETQEKATTDSNASTVPDYTYDELLNRVYNIMREKNPGLDAGEKRKFVMRPPNVARAGSKKTAFSNFADICKLLKRSPKHLLAFLLAELGTSGSIDGSDQLIIKGKFQQKHVESVLRKYIKEYVTCHTCKSAETVLEKDTRIYFLQCETCGSRCSVATIKSGFQAVTTKRAQTRAAGP